MACERRMPSRRFPDNSRDAQGEFPLGTAEYFFYLQYMVARRRDMSFDEILRPTGLSVARWRSLAVIRRLETCTMSQLSQFAAVDRTTLTRSVDQLVSEGLVERWTPQQDRRRVNLALTEQGEEVYLGAVRLLIDRNRMMLEGVDLEDVRVATRVMQQVLRNLAANEREAGELVSFGRPDKPFG